MIKLEQESIAKLDQGQYVSSDLIEVKIPLHLPYYNQRQETFERYDGQMQVDGKWIDFVQRRVCNDTLYLKCLPNKAKTQLQEAKHNQIASETGNPPSGKPMLKKVKPDHSGPLPGLTLQSQCRHHTSISATHHVSQLASGIKKVRPEPPRKDC